MEQKTDTFLFLSSNPSTSFSSTDEDFDLNNLISPTVLLYITLLSIVFFVASLIHRLVGFLLRPQPPLDHAYEESSSVLQGLFQTQFSGVDQAVIDALPLFPYKRMVGLRHDLFDCAVCLNEFKDEDELRLLPKCSHAFHVNCVDTWLLSNSTCPLCRDNLLAVSSSHVVVLVHESDGETSPDDSDSQLNDIESKLNEISGQNDESMLENDERSVLIL